MKLSIRIMLAIQVIAIQSVTAVYAQDILLPAKERKITLGVTGGYSAAMGNFVKTDYADSKAGFAGPGYNVGLTGAHQLKKNFGVMAIASYTSYASKGIQNLAAGYKEDFAIDSSTVYTKGANYTISVMAGPYYSFAVSNNCSVTAYGLAGFVNAHLAGNRVDVEDNEASSFEQKPAAANTWTLQAGIIAGYNLCRHYGISIGAAYYYSRPDFSIDNVNRVNNAGRLLTNYYQPIAGINTNLGIYYRL